MTPPAANEDHPVPAPDSAAHLSLETMEARLADVRPPADHGTLEMIVCRPERRRRRLLRRAVLSPERGLAGDVWELSPTRNGDAQISLIQSDVVRVLANGQPPYLSGDNLHVGIDLTTANLPVGSRLRIGGAIVEITPKKHRGCATFAERFGPAARTLTADPGQLHRRLRGAYARVVEGGVVGVGDPIVVLDRGGTIIASETPMDPGHDGEGETP